MKQRLRVRAAENGRSMEEEVRDLLRKVLGVDPKPNLAASLRKRVASFGGVELDVSQREEMKLPIKLG